MTSDVHPWPLVLRDAIPWRGGDAIIDERLNAMRTLVDHPMAVVTAKRHRVVVTAPGSDDHHSVTIRNALVGGHDGDGGRTTWLAIGRAIQLRIEDIQDGAGDTDLADSTIEDVRRHVHGLKSLWSIREARFANAADVPLERTPELELRRTLLSSAVDTCIAQVGSAMSMQGMLDDVSFSIITSMHRPPSLELKRSNGKIGQSNIYHSGPTQFPEMSGAISSTFDQRLRGCMVGQNASNHLTLRCCEAVKGEVSPMDVMETLRARTDRRLEALPVEFS
jgi:hypothetical protein